MVLAFRVSFLFAVWAGACFIFCCLGGGAGPAQTAKITNTPPPKQQKNKHAPAPSERVLFCCLGGWACLCFCCLGGGGVVMFCCLGGGRVFFFPFWAGSCVLFLLCGRGTGVHSLTGLPGSSSSDPTTKKTKQQKQKKARVPVYRPKP